MTRFSITFTVVFYAELGLAIARRIAEAHDGRLELLSSNESGTTFILILPPVFAE